MVLVADNTSGHHKRQIGSLSGLNNAKLVGLMVKYEVEYIDIPMNCNVWHKLSQTHGDSDIQDKEDCVQIDCIAEEQKKRASTTKPRIYSIEELRITSLQYLKEETPQALVCKVEELLKEEGHEIFWTLPYCPELQPIEIFWVVGKWFS